MDAVQRDLNFLLTPDQIDNGACSSTPPSTRLYRSRDRRDRKQLAKVEHHPV